MKSLSQSLWVHFHRQELCLVQNVLFFFQLWLPVCKVECSNGSSSYLPSLGHSSLIAKKSDLVIKCIQDSMEGFPLFHPLFSLKTFVHPCTSFLLTFKCTVVKQCSVPYTAVCCFFFFQSTWGNKLMLSGEGGQRRVSWEKASRATLQSDAIGKSSLHCKARIKEQRAEPLTCRLIIQQSTGTANEIYRNKKGALGAWGSERETWAYRQYSR